MQEFLEYIISSLIDGDDYSITLSGERFTVALPKSEMGKVIGKQGKIVKSIRTLIRGASAKQGVLYSVEVVEKE